MSKRRKFSEEFKHEAVGLTRQPGITVSQVAPDVSLIGLPRAADLPGVRRKLQNLAQRSPAKRAADHRQLAETLNRIGRKKSVS